MKKKLVLVCFLLGAMLTVNAQAKITGFMGIEFGVSLSKFKSEMSRKGFSRTSSSKTFDAIIYDVDFGKFKGCSVYAMFLNDKFYDARVYIKPAVATGFAALYDEVVEELSGKYGKGVEEAPSRPSRSGLSHTQMMKKIEDAGIYYEIEWPIVEGTQLKLFGSSLPAVAVMYRDIALRDAEQKKIDARNIADY